MIDTTEILGVAPWVAISAILTWAATAWHHIEAKKKEKTDHGDRLEIHRDELTFELLQNARQEMSSARVEVEDLRDEVRKLRTMEQHFYHFQQSLDHLEALLFAETSDARSVAERNAQAFLTRMRRVNEAKSTLANEAQRAASKVEVTGKNIETVEKDMRDNV
jgi:uncharacterized protein (UPF0335 family)